MCQSNKGFLNVWFAFDYMTSNIVDLNFKDACVLHAAVCFHIDDCDITIYKGIFNYKPLVLFVY